MTTELVRASSSHDTGAILSALYGRVTVFSPDRSAETRIDREVVGTMTFDRLRMDTHASFVVQAQPHRVINIAQIHHGELRIRYGQLEVRTGPGGLIAAGALKGRYHAETENLDGDITTLPVELLTDAAATEYGGVSPAVRLLSHHPVSPAATAQFARVRTHVLQAARQVPPELGADAAQLVFGSLTRLMAAVVLATFPNTALTEPTRVDRHDAHPDSLRRAVAFIESHPDRDISVADIAHAAYVTARALQLGFRRHLDTTPMAYLRRVRLDRAHTDLQSASPTSATVTVIATRWGYSRSSRFAADYTATFGRHPQDTLRT